MKLINLGVKYCKYVDENKVEVIRVLNDKNPNEIKCYLDDDFNKRRKMPLSVLESEYVRLRPDGFIYFNIVKMKDNLEDVIVTLYRSLDVDQKIGDPYCVCRQNITDLFANTIMTSDMDNLICGVSVTKDTIPENVKMNDTLVCDGLITSVGVAIYIDDTLVDIMKFIKSKEYDTVLYNLFVDALKSRSKIHNISYKDNINKRFFKGYCKNLRDLLLINNFMYDFDRGFDIIPLNIVIRPEEINSSLCLDHELLLSSVLAKNITSSLVVKYSKYIDMDKVEHNYVLIRDGKDIVYLIAYFYNGTYQVPIQDIETEDNINKIAKLPGYKNNESIKHAIKFNKDKYMI